MAAVQSKVEVNDRFEKNIRKLRESAAANGEAATAGKPNQWVLPDPGEWDGDLFNLENLSQPFDRTELGEKFIESVNNRESPGVVGDTVAATTQIDYLGAMERAFRARHTMRRPRAMAHAAGRFSGHGHENGVLTKTALEYVRKLVKQSKGRPPTESSV